jgi:DNA-binding response OmpR family regulator
LLSGANSEGVAALLCRSRGLVEEVRNDPGRWMHFARSRYNQAHDVANGKSNARIVLVVEHDPALAKRIKRGLQHDNGLTLHVVRGGYEALWSTVDRVPDVVLLDSELPDIDATKFCRILRSRERTARVPIIVLAGDTATSARLIRLPSSANDYVTKRFSNDDLHARVHLALRRDPPPHHMRLASYQGRHIRANFGVGFVAVDRKPVNLTRREFDLLWYLIEHRDEVIPGERLLRAVWSDAYVDVRTVLMHVSRLRAKLGPAGKQIQTLVRRGYLFSEKG